MVAGPLALLVVIEHGRVNQIPALWPPASRTLSAPGGSAATGAMLRASLPQLPPRAGGAWYILSAVVDPLRREGEGARGRATAPSSRPPCRARGGGSTCSGAPSEHAPVRARRDHWRRIEAPPRRSRPAPCAPPPPGLRRHASPASPPPPARLPVRRRVACARCAVAASASSSAASAARCFGRMRRSQAANASTSASPAARLVAASVSRSMAASMAATAAAASLSMRRHSARPRRASSTAMPAQPQQRFQRIVGHGGSSAARSRAKLSSMLVRSSRAWRSIASMRGASATASSTAGSLPAR